MTHDDSLFDFLALVRATTTGDREGADSIYDNADIGALLAMAMGWISGELAKIDNGLDSLAALHEAFIRTAS